MMHVAESEVNNESFRLELNPNLHNRVCPLDSCRALVPKVHAPIPHCGIFCGACCGIDVDVVQGHST